MHHYGGRNRMNLSLSGYSPLDYAKHTSIGAREAGQHVARIERQVASDAPRQLHRMLGDDLGRDALADQVAHILGEGVGAVGHILAGRLHGIQLVADLPQQPGIHPAASDAWTTGARRRHLWDLDPIGEPGWDRTNDHLIKSQMLYR
jgi:hypothetical protein